MAQHGAKSQRVHAQRSAKSRSPSPRPAASPVRPATLVQPQSPPTTQQQAEADTSTLDELYGARPAGVDAADGAGAKRVPASTARPVHKSSDGALPSGQQQQELQAAGAKGRRRSLFSAISKKVRSKFESSEPPKAADVLDHAAAASQPGVTLPAGYATVTNTRARLAGDRPSVFAVFGAGTTKGGWQRPALESITSVDENAKSPLAAPSSSGSCASPTRDARQQRQLQQQHKSSSASTGSAGAGRLYFGANRQHLAHLSLDSQVEALGARFAFMAPSALKQPADQAFVTSYEMMRLAHDQPSVAMCALLRTKQCYELVPNSTKLVIFDTQLPVRKAFFALVYNGVRAAPLWDSQKQAFVGMLTITDFIRILHRYYKGDTAGGQAAAAAPAAAAKPPASPSKVAGGSITELETHKIATWRDVLSADGALRPLDTIDVSESLYKAVKTLCQRRVHRLPVRDSRTGNMIYILTHKRIIKYLFLHMQNFPRADYMDKTPHELNIGCWKDIVTVRQWTPVIDAMSLFLSRRVSAVPVLDADGAVVDIYAKFDALNLAAEHTYNQLHGVTVAQALKHRDAWFEGVKTCSERCSLGTVIERLVRAEVHRMVVADEHRRPVGLISLSDILRFLVIDNDVEMLLPQTRPQRHSASSLTDLKPSDSAAPASSGGAPLLDAAPAAAGPQLSPQPVHLGAGPKRLFETQPVGAHETILDVEHEHDHDHEHEHEVLDASNVKCEA